jgi:hypothetical protein
MKQDQYLRECRGSLGANMNLHLRFLLALSREGSRFSRDTLQYSFALHSRFNSTELLRRKFNEWTDNPEMRCAWYLTCSRMIAASLKFGGSQRHPWNEIRGIKISLKIRVFNVEDFRVLAKIRALIRKSKKDSGWPWEDPPLDWCRATTWYSMYLFRFPACFNLSIYRIVPEIPEPARWQ